MISGDFDPNHKEGIARNPGDAFSALFAVLRVFERTGGKCYRFCDRPLL